MFKRVKESMIIEKAYILCRQEMGVDAKAMISRMDFPERAAAREGLRQMIRHRGLEVNDVAVMLIVPLLPWLRGDAFHTMFNVVVEWEIFKKIQPEVKEHYRKELENCPGYIEMLEQDN